MSDSPFFSIIVPVYNVEQFLRQCIDSILIQEFSDFEVLLIDDGSTDSSGKVCDEYANMDTRIKTWHQKNCGLGMARNTGILHANGTWILFMDSDDYWVPDTLKKVNKVIAEKQDDTLFVFRYMEDCMGKITIPPQKGFVSGVDSIDHFPEFLSRYEMTAGWAVWKLAIHRKLIYQKETLLFLDNVTHGEDIYWLIRLFQRAGEITYCNEDIYRYRIRERSLSGTTPSNCMKWRESLSNTFDWFWTHKEFDKDGYVKQFVATHYLPHIFDSASIETKSVWKNHYVEMKKMLLYTLPDMRGKRGKILMSLAHFPKEICFWGCLLLKKTGQIRQRKYLRES